MTEHSTISLPSPAASPVVYSYPEIDSTGVTVDDDANVMQRAIRDSLPEIRKAMEDAFFDPSQWSGGKAILATAPGDAAVDMALHEALDNEPTYGSVSWPIEDPEMSDDLEFISDEVAAEFGNLMMIHRHNLKAAESRVVYLEREVLDLDLQIRELAGQLKDAKATHKEQVDSLAESKDDLERLANSPPTMDDARRGVEKKTKAKRGAT